MSRRRILLDRNRDVTKFLAESAADPTKLIICYWVTGLGPCTCCCDEEDLPEDHNCGQECQRPAVRIAEMFLAGKQLPELTGLCATHLPMFRRLTNT
jgi:hypothetical protein